MDCHVSILDMFCCLLTGSAVGETNPTAVSDEGK